jgi:hypothetical protein
MTKKDYIIIATALGQSIKELKTTDSTPKAVNSIVEHICHALQIDNPGFKPETFRNYVTKISKQ